MQDSENNKPDSTESTEPSPELSPQPGSDTKPLNVPPGMGLREINATYEMLVRFKEAVRDNTWPGDTVQAVAMGLQMIITLEGQYRGQVERMRAMEKEAVKRAKQAINDAGGQVNGENGQISPTPTIH